MGNCFKKQNVVGLEPTKIAKSQQENLPFPFIETKSFPKSLQTQDIEKNLSTSPYLGIQGEALVSPQNMRKINLLENTQVFKSRNSKGQKTLNHYIFIEDLGRGATGKVKLAIKNEGSEQEKFAIKIISQNFLKNKREYTKDEKGNLKINNGIENMKHEIAIMKKIDNVNVIRLHEIIHDLLAEKIYIVMEYAEYGEIISWNESSSTFSLGRAFLTLNQPFLSENLLKHLFKGCINGLAYLHQNNIIH